jgi:hypothetical protein
MQEIFLEVRQLSRVLDILLLKGAQESDVARFFVNPFASPPPNDCLEPAALGVYH